MTSLSNVELSDSCDLLIIMIVIDNRDNDIILL